jgi:xanthine dehydrogenase YagS FAD-binding subunit
MRAISYRRADDLASAAKAFRGSGSAYLAGGTTLLDLMKLDVLQPDTLIDISGFPATKGIRIDARGLHLNAAVRMAEAAAHPGILKSYPVVAQSLLLAASPQIRNMATLAGNVLQRTRCSYYRDTRWSACNKRDPGSGCAAMEGVTRKLAVLGTSSHCIANYPGDFAQALVALEAEVEISTANGARVIQFEDLHRLPGDTPHIETTLEPGEIITGFRVPAGNWTPRSLYLKVRDRESYEFALASAAVALELEGEAVKEARIALGGVATRPWRAREAEAALKGKPVNEANAGKAAAAAFDHVSVKADNAYKVELGKRTLTRALLQAASMEV